MFSVIVAEVLVGFLQTGSGKTYTMMGEIKETEGYPSEDSGITPRVFDYLFMRIREVRYLECPCFHVNTQIDFPFFFFTSLMGFPIIHIIMDCLMCRKKRAGRMTS